MREKLVPAVAAFFIAMPIFSIRSLSHDYLAHNGIARQLLAGEQSPPHPLYHLTLIALCGCNMFASAGISVFISAASVATATWLAASMISRAGAPPPLTMILSILLAFAMPLPNWWGGDRFLSSISPNIWHNPTGVFAMPFALGLFMAATRFLDRPEIKNAFLVGVLAVLSLLAKPNYFLAFAPGFGISLIVVARHLRGSTALGVLALAFGPAFLVLGAQFLWLTHDTTVLFVPFKVWNLFASDHIPGSVLVGIAFPLSVILLYPRRAIADRSLILAWVTLLVGIGTYACFAEESRLPTANFGWGMIFANHVLFVVSTAFLIPLQSEWRRWICLGLLAFHALSGIQYIETTDGRSAHPATLSVPKTD